MVIGKRCNPGLQNVFAPPISQSAPHIYISALPFVPENSPIGQALFTYNFPTLLSLTCGKAVNWPSIIHVFEGHTSSVWSVAFSPDGKQIVSGSEDNSIRVWDAVSGDVVVGPLKGHTDLQSGLWPSHQMASRLCQGHMTTPFECGML
jgi:WD40 repeat protein